MDRLLRRFGLSGKAFIPMLMGLAARCPPSWARAPWRMRDRRMTIMLVPFMTCSARLPVYGLISAAFFPQYGDRWSSRCISGAAFHDCPGIILKKTMFRGEPAAFVLELPPYRCRR